MYDPTIGRWLTEDPLGLDAGDANLYRYVGNGAINGVDPTGLNEDKPPAKPPTKPTKPPYEALLDPNLLDNLPDYARPGAGLVVPPRLTVPGAIPPGYSGGSGSKPPQYPGQKPPAPQQNTIPIYFKPGLQWLEYELDYGINVKPKPGQPVGVDRVELKLKLKF